MLPQGLDKPAAALLFMVSGERETFSGTEKELTKITLAYGGCAGVCGCGTGGGGRG
jgi:hypothetical protein